MSTETNPLVALIVAPIVYALTLPTFIGTLIVNEIVRRIVKVLLWFQYGHAVNLIEDGLDAFFNHKSNGNTRNVTVVGILDEDNNDNNNVDLDLEKYAQRFEKRVLLHEEVEQTGWPFFGLSTTPTMKGKPYRPYEKLEKIVTSAYGYYCWKYDDKFDVRRHFRVLDDDKVYTERDIMQLLSTLTLDMNESKPQWEFIFVQRFQNSKGEMKRIQIFNFHHSYMDGLSLMMMLDRHLMDQKVPMQLDPMTIKIPLWKKMLYYINGVVYAPHLYLRLLLNLNKKTWVTNSPAAAPRGKKTFAWSTPIDMDLMKKIRTKTKATIPNVVAQAFVKSIKEVLPRERVLDSLMWGEIVAIVPYQNSDPQNRFSLFSYPVSTTDLTGSVEEFQKTIFRMKRQRTAAIHGPHPLLFFYMFKLCGRLPHFLYFDSMDIGQSSVYLSNVPTFTKKIAYFDSTCEEFCPFPPMPNKTAIMLASISYADHVKITGAADSTWLSQDEMERIFIEMPKVIQAMAELGYIPDELPELKKVDQDKEILPVPEEEEEEEKVVLSSSTNVQITEVEEEEEEENFVNSHSTDNIQISEVEENIPIFSSIVEVAEEKDEENGHSHSTEEEHPTSLEESSPATASNELSEEEEKADETNESKKEEKNVVKISDSNDTTTTTTTTQSLTNGHNGNDKKGDDDDDVDEDQSPAQENGQQEDVDIKVTSTRSDKKETKVINNNGDSSSAKLNGNNNHKTEKKTKSKKKNKNKTAC